MNLLDLLPELLTAICNLDPIACQRLWIYLHDRGEIKPDGWARELAITETIDGTTATLLFGQLHSVDDLPAVKNGGGRFWYHRGKLHRDGSPAIEQDTFSWMWIIHDRDISGQYWYENSTGNYTEFWFQHGELARDDGHLELICWGTDYLIHVPGMTAQVNIYHSSVTINFNRINYDTLRADYMI